MTDSPRFIADAMLGSLARKLRIFGYDCRYFKRGDDRSLMAIAKADGRVVLTFDRGLSEAAHRRGIICFLLDGTTDRQRLESLANLAVSESVLLRAGKTRCPLCNRVLRVVRKDELTAQVSDGTLKRHRLFYECQHCGKAYWKGRHWTRLRSLATAVDGKKDLTLKRTNASNVAHRPARQGSRGTGKEDTRAVHSRRRAGDTKSVGRRAPQSEEGRLRDAKEQR